MNLPAILRRQAAEHEARTSEGGVHDRQVDIRQCSRHSVFRAARPVAGHSFRVPSTCSHLVRGQPVLNPRLAVPQEVQRSQRYVRSFRSQLHDVEVHAVELDVWIEHGKARRREVHCGELHIVPVQRLFHHRLVQFRGMASSGFDVPPLYLGSDRHEQGACAARQVRHIESRWKLVVFPIDLRRPVVEYESR